MVDSRRFANGEPQICVGIMARQELHFCLNGPYRTNDLVVRGEQTVEVHDGQIEWAGNLYEQLVFTPTNDEATFSLSQVVIGVDFHWERCERQTFSGGFRLVMDGNRILVINELPVENYLLSVISSEMKSTCSLEFLKAAAVISRSWLFAQLEKRDAHVGGSNQSVVRSENELIYWFDRENHALFDVCADDHCQRYQGVTRVSSPQVAQAISETRGQVLTCDGQICDARFSKCCGGRTNEYAYCWENLQYRYLQSVTDPYCNTNDRDVLAQVLNDYDLETQDFYRWTVEFTQERLQRLLLRKMQIDLGDIRDLVPIERGPGEHISRLQILGTKSSLVIGKELVIRKALSDSHLKSSAFDVERLNVNADGIPAGFLLHGRGWGHGVGMCQIGAAVMGQKGAGYGEILSHYYPGAIVEKIY